MNLELTAYADIVGDDVINHLKQLASMLKGLRVVHVNSTRQGGGVAEILARMIPLKNELGIDASWEVIEGDTDFYETTKSFHNGLQGNPVDLTKKELEHYEEVNHENAENLRDILTDADVVFIHDPQPAPFLSHFPKRKGVWIWRCHIDVSKPHPPVWKYLRNHVNDYDASIWSLSEFARKLEHPQYLIPPSIDPLSDKNRDLSEDEIDEAYKLAEIDPDRPKVVQVSRYDRFKDPVGVIEAFRLAKRFLNLQLILAGGDAKDDPEGAEVLEEVREKANGDPDIHILMLPADANVQINALQRIADIIIQKSTKEGFGLTVTEGLWKGKPVIGGAVGGIKLQIIDHHTGFLVHTPEGAAMRMRYLIMRPEIREDMGKKARRFVLENFLLTRHLREYLTLMVAHVTKSGDRIVL